MADARPDGRLGIAFYNGGGTFVGGTEHERDFYAAVGGAATTLSRQMQTSYELINFTEHNVSSTLTRANADLVIFPGGSGGGQAQALGPAGMAAVRAFVHGGGGYIGTCGGAFLAIQHLKLYGDPAPPTVEPWMRGHGPVSVEFTSEGLEALRLDPGGYSGKNVTIEYWQGPIVKTVDLPSTVTVLSHFRTEIHKLYPNRTTGTMVGTPAMTSALFGQGVVVLNSPHPEIPPEHGGRSRPEIYAGELAHVLPRSGAAKVKASIAAVAAVSAAVTEPVPRVEIAPGVRMPLLNFGVQPDHAAAIRLGVRGLDTANVYGDQQQREVGRAVRESGIPREEFFVTSKIPCCPGLQFTKGAPNCDHPRDPAADAAHDFDVLGLEYVDLMLLHWPCDTLKDTLAAYRALESLVAHGQARAIGVSNFNASALDALLAQPLEMRPVVDQVGYSIAGHSDSAWGRDDGSRKACVAANCTFSAYSPLGGWAKGGTSHVLGDPTVRAVAAAHNRSAAQVALRWVVQQGIVAVTSSEKIEHVASDLAIFDFSLTDAEMAELEKVV